MTKTPLHRVLPALVLLSLVAACGVDGEPETPTRSVSAPALPISAEAPR